MFVLSVKIINFLKENMNLHEYFASLSPADAEAIANEAQKIEKGISKKAGTRGYGIEALVAALMAFTCVQNAASDKRISDLEEQVKLLLNKKEG